MDMATNLVMCNYSREEEPQPTDCHSISGMQLKQSNHLSLPHQDEWRNDHRLAQKVWLYTNGHQFPSPQLTPTRYEIDLVVTNPVFGGLQTTKAQTSLRIRADWSVHLLFAYWKVSYLNLLQTKFQYSS